MIQVMMASSKNNSDIRQVYYTAAASCVKALGPSFLRLSASTLVDCVLRDISVPSTLDADAIADVVEQTENAESRKRRKKNTNTAPPTANQPDAPSVTVAIAAAQGTNIYTIIINGGGSSEMHDGARGNRTGTNLSPTY
jgi:hypothetical protein